ncbi:MAG: GldG family protein [Acidobacteria bacterium]|nr:GldG family protein [Acidobacteriota bacterium]
MKSRNAYRAGLGMAVILGLGILVLVNWLGARHYRRFDWTKSGLYSLSEKTENVLKGLKKPVTVTVFITEGAPLYAESQELLKRYKAKSNLITVETLDPTRNPARAEALAKEFGVRGSTVVFRSGDRKKYVSEGQLAEFDFSRTSMGGEPTMKAFKGEQEFTSALIQVTAEESPKVVFTTGHGERKAEDRSRDGFYALSESLKRDNCTVEEWPSLGANEVPPGTTLVVIAAPESAFTEPEVDVLKKYLAGGGRLLLFADAAFAPGDPSKMADAGLSPLLAEFGLKLESDIVVDLKNRLPMMGPETVIARSFRPHPITTVLEGQAVLFPVARSISVNEKLPEGVTVNVLAETSAEGWGETNLADLNKAGKDDADVKGPVALAVAAETKGAAGKDARVVVFGDADFASIGFVGNGANLYLLVAAANWALQREALIAIPPRDADLVSVTLSRSDMGQIWLVVVVVLPLSAILMGLAVWVRRRR